MENAINNNNQGENYQEENIEVFSCNRWKVAYNSIKFVLV